jgi:hypothetical protein
LLNFHFKEIVIFCLITKASFLAWDVAIASRNAKTGRSGMDRLMQHACSLNLEKFNAMGVSGSR